MELKIRLLVIIVEKLVTTQMNVQRKILLAMDVMKEDIMQMNVQTKKKTHEKIKEEIRRIKEIKEM